MDDSISRFWDNYISKTTTCNIPEHARRWYVKHVEAYIKAHHNRRLAETGPDDIAYHLEELGRKPEFPDIRVGPTNQQSKTRNTAMKAAWYERQGPPSEVLVIGEMTTPEPGPGEVRIRVAASGVNPGDVKKCRDTFGVGMPYPPACDFS